MIFDQLFADTAAEGSRRRREVMGSVSGGLKALANLLTTTAGAPSARLSPFEGRLSETAAKERKSADDPERRYLAAARSHFDASLRTLRSRRDQAVTDSRIAAEQRRVADAAAEQTRRERLTDKRIEQIDSRIANDTRRAEAAAGRRNATGRSGSGGGNFTWVHPTTGRRYSVAKSAWDKSAHTLFQIVVDATRPAPDRRGYPTAEEWRRHCYETYRGRDRRESFIIRNLPTSAPALEYLTKLTAK